MKTEDLIVRLAQSAGAVQPLAPPLERFGRWAIAATVATIIGVAIIGVRPDAEAMRQSSVVVVAILTLVTALAAAVSALVLSVPGAERSAAQR